MTSNLPFSKWEAVFKDAMMTAAAIDRLVHHSVIIELNIPSYRAEQPRRINRRKAKARANEAAVGAKSKNGRKESCGNAGLWKAWKAKSRLPPLSTAPWKSRHKQARFPHSHSSGDGAMEKWKSKDSFPTFPPRSLYLSKNSAGGLRPPPAEGNFLLGPVGDLSIWP